MVGLQIGSQPCTHASLMRMMRNNSETRQAHLTAQRQAQVETPASPASRLNASPPRTYTRINGHTIPRVERPLYMPLFSQEYCTAHLSHSEWWASLDPDVRRAIASCGEGEHLANASSEDRFHLVNSAKWWVEWGGAVDEYNSRVQAAFTEIGNHWGLQLSSWAGSGGTGINQPQFNLAFFQCPDGERNGRILAVMADGRKVYVEVPPDFTQEDFNRFNADKLTSLLYNHGLAHTYSTPSRMKQFFEEIFAQLFPQN